MEYVLRFSRSDYECSWEELAFVRYDGDADDLMLALEMAAVKFIKEEDEIRAYNQPIQEQMRSIGHEAKKVRHDKAAQFMKEKIASLPALKLFDYNAYIEVPGTGKTFFRNLLVDGDKFDPPEIIEMYEFIQSELDKREVR